MSKYADQITHGKTNNEYSIDARSQNNKEMINKIKDKKANITDKSGI